EVEHANGPEVVDLMVGFPVQGLTPDETRLGEARVELFETERPDVRARHPRHAWPLVGEGIELTVCYHVGEVDRQALPAGDHLEVAVVAVPGEGHFDAEI